MPSRRIKSSTVQLSIAIIFMALVCVATISFTVSVPSTKGFFNIGETMVYITALLFGPLVGAFAGGAGSALADLLLGYYYYAPATLVIKALEGGVVGFLSRKKPPFSKRSWRIFTLGIGLLVGALVSLIGSLYYSGTVEFYYGLLPPENPTSTVFIPMEFWLGLGIFVVISTMILAFVSEPEYVWIVISTIFGGLLMVLGYFLYEQFILGVLAIAEVPVNIGQMTIGLIIATPIVKIIQRTLPQIKD
ncbi:MAG: ECF transporter S component [Candidatus Bathycorpusculaceae bacterium]